MPPFDVVLPRGRWARGTVVPVGEPRRHRGMPGHGDMIRGAVRSAVRRVEDGVTGANWNKEQGQQGCLGSKGSQFRVESGGLKFHQVPSFPASRTRVC